MGGVLTEGFLLLAGVCAGVIGTAGGITSLVAYPALLAAGLPPLTANVTSSVALLGSGLSSAVLAGPDVRARARASRLRVPAFVLLSLAGAALLVLTPAAVFSRVVPVLVAAGSLVLLLQPALGRWLAGGGRALPRPLVLGAGAVVAIYNGYFGAGAGILLIALLLLTTEPVLHRANAMKNVILVASDVLPAVLFGVRGVVAWQAVWPLALGAVLGGLIGPRVARRVPAAVLRTLIALCGFALAARLLLAP